METLGVKVEPGVEHIQNGSELLAIILSYRYREEGIRFFTPDEFSQQLAFMRHPAGKLIAPHVHNPVKREVQFTQETLFIRKGKLRVDFFDADAAVSRKPNSWRRRCDFADPGRSWLRSAGRTGDDRGQARALRRRGGQDVLRRPAAIDIENGARKLTDSVFREYGRYYDLLYRDKDYLGETAYVHDLLVRFGVPTGAVLELGSGTGRHGRLLAKAGYTVFGLERSETMIALACAGEETPGFTCQRGDIRSARLERKFDAVISLFHVISYQVSDEDLLETFRTARAHVSAGAPFIFDFWYGPAVIAQKPSVREKIFEDEHLTVRRRSEPSWDMSQNRVDVHFRVAITDKTEGRSYDLNEIHPMRYFFLPEIEIIGQETGFAFVAAEEFVTGAPPSTETWGVCAVLRAV